MLREAVFLFLGENQLPVRDYLKNAPAGLDEPGINIQFFFQGFRQTGGCGVVVSFHAVFNGYFCGHFFSFRFIINQKNAH